MMAKWSEIFALLKMRLLGRTHFASGSRARRRRTRWLAQFSSVLDGAMVILRQVAGVGSRIGQHLVLLVERLRERQRGARGEAEAAIGFALEGGEVVEERRTLRGGLLLFLDRAGLAFALGEMASAGLVPDALGALWGRRRPSSTSRRTSGRGTPPAARNVPRLPSSRAGEGADLFLALDEDGEGRRLHAADRGLLKPPDLELKAVIARVPLMPTSQSDSRAATRGVGEREQLVVGPQTGEAVADGGRGHRLQPQPLDGLWRSGVCTM